MQTQKTTCRRTWRGSSELLNEVVTVAVHVNLDRPYARGTSRMHFRVKPWMHYALETSQYVVGGQSHGVT